MIRFNRLRAHNIGPFKDIAVDFDALPPIVAITGANGAGKSTMLELLAAGITREGPTRGPLVGLATARDSFVEVGLTNGQPWTIRQSVDVVSGKGEALVTDASGRPAFESTKVRAHDEWAAKHLPPPSVLFSSTFGSQGSAGFLALKPGERKSVLLRVLGIERLERMAAQARDELSAARGRHAVASARVEGVVGVTLDEALRALAVANENAVGTLDAIERARAALTAAIEERGRVAEVLRARREQEERRIQLQRAHRTLVAAIDDARARIENNRALVGRRGEIEAAVAGLAEHRARLATLDAQLVAGTADKRRLDDAIASSARALHAELDRWAATCDQRERRATPTASLRATVDHAIAALDGMRYEASEAARVLEECTAEDEALAGQAIAGAEQRIVGLRTGISSAIETAEMNAPAGWDIARAALRDDNAAVALAQTLPAQKASVRARLVAARDRATVTARALRDAEAMAARAEEVRLAQLDLVGVAAERGQIADERAALASSVKGAQAECDRVRAANAAIRAEQSERREAIAVLEPVAARADKLAAAAARIEELEAALARDVAARHEIEQQLAALPDPADAPPRAPDVAAAERAVAVAEQAHQRATAAVAVAEAERVAATERDALRAELEAARDAVAVEISDWKRLADDLGRDGIQALKIDAAGPELSALANDLLHTCVGPRWTVTIDTQRTGADGRLLESLEVRVLDTEAGRDAPVETFSGGERVLLGEAVSLALAMLACRRSGQRDVTIVRDESGAALDGERGRAYVAMLRRALTLTGARQVLLVTHVEDVAALCDARLHVEGGKVEVRA